MYQVLRQLMDGIAPVRSSKVKIALIGTMRKVFQEETGKEKFRRLKAVCAADSRVQLITADAVNVPDGIIYAGNLDGIDRTVNFLLGQGVDGVIVVPVNYGDEEAAARIGSKIHRALRIPIYTYVFPDEPILDDGRRVGDQECGILPMRQLMRCWMGQDPGAFPFTNFTEDKFVRAYDRFIRICSGIRAMRNVRGLQLGADQPTFYAIEYPRLDFQKRFGTRVETLELLTLKAFLDSSLAGTKPDWFADLKQDTFGDLDSSAVDALGMDIVDKLTLTLGFIISTLKDKQSNSVSIRCWDELMKATGMMICPLNGILYENGIMAACETDWPGNVASAFLHGLGLGDDRDLNFFADLTRWDDGKPLWWHCGPFPKGGLRGGKGCLKCGWIFPSFTAGGLLDGTWGEINDEVTLCQLRPNAAGQLQLVALNGAIVDGPATIGTHFYTKVADPDAAWNFVNTHPFDHHNSGRIGDYLSLVAEAGPWLNLDTKPAVLDNV